MSEHATRSMGPIDWSTINAIYTDSADSLLRIRTIGDEGVHDPFVSCWHSDPVSYTLAGTFSYKHKLTRTRPHVRARRLCTLMRAYWSPSIPIKYRRFWGSPNARAPRTETPVARDVALRNIRGLCAFDAPRERRSSAESWYHVDRRVSRTNDDANNLILWIFWDGAFFLYSYLHTYIFYLYILIFKSLNL